MLKKEKWLINTVRKMKEKFNYSLYLWRWRWMRSTLLRQREISLLCDQTQKNKWKKLFDENSREKEKNKR